MIQRTLRTLREFAVAVSVATGLTALIQGIAALVMLGVPMLGFRIFARLATTTVAWPNPEVVAMRERVEQLLPPPPASSFVNATVTTYYDGDQWKCVEYKAEASAQDTHAYYERAKQQMRWGANDGYGFAGPDLMQQALVAVNTTVTVTPWDQGVFAESASPPHRVAVCYSYERWLWPVNTRRPIMVASWPDPSVIAAREKVEQAYPPDAAWSFSSATLTRHPDGWRQTCITYLTEASETDARAYYETRLRRGPQGHSAGGPLLGKSSVRAKDGAVTLCPF